MCLSMLSLDTQQKMVGSGGPSLMIQHYPAATSTDENDDPHSMCLASEMFPVSCLRA